MPSAANDGHCAVGVASVRFCLLIPCLKSLLAFGGNQGCGVPFTNRKTPGMLPHVVSQVSGHYCFRLRFSVVPRECP